MENESLSLNLETSDEHDKVQGVSCSHIVVADVDNLFEISYHVTEMLFDKVWVVMTRRLTIS